MSLSRHQARGMNTIVALCVAAFVWSQFLVVEVYAKKIRMGYLQADLHHLAAFVTLDKNMYRAAGLDVEVAGVFGAGPELMLAFASGDLDFAYVGESPAIVAVANRMADVRMLAQANLEGSGVVVHRESKIGSVKELLKKTIAIPGYSTVQDFLLRKVMRANGLDSKQANIMVLKPPEMIGALETKQIDAYVAWEPFVARARVKGFGKLLIASKEMWPGHPCCALVVMSAFLRESPSEVQKIVSAHVESTRWIKDHPEESIAIAQKYTGMDPKTIEVAMGNIHYHYVPSVEGAKDYITFLKEVGYIKTDNPGLMIDTFIDLSFLRGGPPK
jgi:NitT/TauT family transport system substrate-binding protein